MTVSLITVLRADPTASCQASREVTVQCLKPMAQGRRGEDTAITYLDRNGDRLHAGRRAGKITGPE